MKRIVSILVIALTAMILWFFVSDQDVTIATNDVNQNVDSVTTTAIEEMPAPTEKGLPFDTSNYAQCLVLTSEVKNRTEVLAREDYHTWYRYLDEGYTIDEVTLAVEHFLNPLFAVTFRIAYLRQNSRLAETNHSLMSQLYDLLAPGEKAPFRIERSVPAKAFLEFPSATQSEKIAIIEREDLYIDDIAYALVTDTFSDEDVLLLINALDDPTAVVGYEKYEAISLLDFAVIGTRPEIVALLLNSGLTPSQDPFLGSTMEWALSRLFHQYDTDNRAAAARIVKRLQETGAQASFEKQSSNNVYGTFPRQFYDFKAEQIESLQYDFGLDIISIEQEPQLSKTLNPSLLSTLQQKLHPTVEQALGLPDVAKLSNVCEGTIDELRNEWKAEYQPAAVQRVMNKHKGDEDTLLAALHTVDPSLVDYYRFSQPPTERRAPISDDLFQRINSVYKMFDKGDIQAGVDYVAAADIHPSQREWVFLKMLDHDKVYFDAIVNSSLNTTLTNFQDLIWPKLLNETSLEALMQAGMAFPDTDKFKQTLVFYAASRRDHALVQYLFDNAFAFSLEPFGQDPLHGVLRLYGNETDLEVIKKTVEAVMLFQPEIDEYHLRRMAVVKLYYPALYAQLTASFPELAIEDDQALPPVYFY